MTQDEKKNSWISAGLPLGCAVLALALVGYEWRNVNIEKTNLATGERKLKLLNENLVAKMNRLGIKVPAVLMTNEEDTRFLEDLKQAASETGTQIVKWSSLGKTTGAESSAAPPPALRGIRSEQSTLEVFGSYDGVRAFVLRLESWPRMLSMTNVSWHRGTKEGTRLSMMLIRYVSEPAAGPVGAPAAPASTGGSQ